MRAVRIGQRPGPRGNSLCPAGWSSSKPRSWLVVICAILLALLLSLFASTAYAQEDGGGQGGESSPEGQPTGEQTTPSNEGSGSTEGSEEGSGEGSDRSVLGTVARGAACNTIPGAELAPGCRDSGGEEGSGSDGGGSGEGSGSGEESNGGNAADEIETPGGIPGIGIDILKAMMGFVWEWSFGWFGDRVGDGLIGAMLNLPDPTASPELSGIYDDITTLLSPVLLIGVLVVSLTMMLKPSNSGISYAGLTALPRIFGVAMVLGALPFLMGQLSVLGAELTTELLPSGEETATAGRELVKAILGQLVVGNVMNLILAIAGLYVLGVVAVVTFFKNVFYILLFLAAPFALFGSLVPGLSNFASAWAKAVLVCAAIPAMWAAEVWVGSRLLADPRQVYGEGADALGFITNGMFTSIIAIIIMWIMYKTPFKVLSWAFVSYDPHRGGGISSFGKWMAFAAGKQALGQVAGAVSQMRGGSGGPEVVGAGGSAGAGSDGPRMTESLKQRTTWDEGPNGEILNQRTSYERNREMRENLDPNTVNMKPPEGHGPTDSGKSPYAQPPRQEPDQLGGGPNNPTNFTRDRDNKIRIIDSDGNGEDR